MKLKYIKPEKQLYEDKKPNKSFVNDMKLIDKNLEVVFNRVSGRWEIYRLSNSGWQWILNVENEDETYRPLDKRILIKLREMDIILRHGSIANYEIHLEKKLSKWKEAEKNRNDHELKWDIKDNRTLWKRAAEEFAKGNIN